MVERMSERGRCHCGTVEIEVDFAPNALPHQCNCSVCAMKGSVMFDVPLAALRVVAGEERLRLYTFNTLAAKHYFCGLCGIHVFHQLRSDPNKFGVNGACFAGRGRYDFASMPVHDGGGSHPKDTGKPMRVAGHLRYERQ